MFNIKCCRILDSNRRPLELEETALPTKPQSLPQATNVCGVLKYPILFYVHITIFVKERPLNQTVKNNRCQVEYANCSFFKVEWYFCCWETLQCRCSPKIIEHLLPFRYVKVERIRLENLNFRIVFNDSRTLFFFSSFLCWWLDSNRRPLVSEATTLPTEPQPLPYLLELFF